MTKEKILYILTLLSLFSLPIKLSWTYITLTPAILLFSYLLITKEIKIKDKILNIQFPLFLFYSTLIISAFFGINLAEALTDSSKALLYSLSPLLFYYILKTYGFKSSEYALALGFAIASIISLFKYSNVLSDKVYSSSISQAGQLAIALSFFAIYKIENLNKKINFLNYKFLIAILIFVSAVCSVLTNILTVKVLTLSFILLNLGLALKNKDKEGIILYLSIPLMLALLILNLKRGPIIGLILATLLYSFFYKRKLSLLIISLSALIFFFAPNFQERLLASIEHFFIKGGRYEIWSVGYELLGRYPLGLGFSSSEFLQNFSLDIPLNLKHFHNNFLNILIECGIIPTLILIWFYIKLASYTVLDNKKNILALAALASVITMQIAGIFEYNFGDSEVLLVGYFFIGVIFYGKEGRVS